MRSLLASQQTFVDRLVQLMKAVQRESGNRKKKVTTEYLHVQILAKPFSRVSPRSRSHVNGSVPACACACVCVCVSADGAAPGSAGRQREGESFRHRAHSSSSGASDQDQRHRPRDGHTLQGAGRDTFILTNPLIICFADF